MDGSFAMNDWNYKLSFRFYGTYFNTGMNQTYKHFIMIPYAAKNKVNLALSAQKPSSDIE